MKPILVTLSSAILLAGCTLQDVRDTSDALDDTRAQARAVQNLNLCKKSAEGRKDFFRRVHRQGKRLGVEGQSFTDGLICR